MDKKDMLRVGVITQAHGIKGEVKVYPTTDDTARFKKLKTVTLSKGKESAEYTVSGARASKGMVILAFKEVMDRNAAELLKKSDILIDRKDAVALGRDEYFITDLIGLKVVDDETGDLIGTLKEVIETGANDVYEITLDPSFLYEGKKSASDMLYAPAIKECVKGVDMEKGEVRLYLMPGLITTKD
ncbi:MAG: 16S rRNA processing protein RimM [Lachnospiraceae bacterium]|nr:16S rRNA processing protein RimM [Lachnospiraceae bacterium]